MSLPSHVPNNKSNIFTSYSFKIFLNITALFPLNEPGYRSWYSHCTSWYSHCITGWTSKTENTSFHSGQGQEVLLVSKRSDPLWDQPNLIMNNNMKFSPGFKLLTRVGDRDEHLSPSNVEFKNEWRYASIPHVASQHAQRQL